MLIWLDVCLLPFWAVYNRTVLCGSSIKILACFFLKFRLPDLFLVFSAACIGTEFFCTFSWCWDSSRPLVSVQLRRWKVHILPAALTEPTRRMIRVCLHCRRHWHRQKRITSVMSSITRISCHLVAYKHTTGVLYMCCANIHGIKLHVTLLFSHRCRPLTVHGSSWIFHDGERHNIGSCSY